MTRTAESEVADVPHEKAPTEAAICGSPAHPASDCRSVEVPSGLLRKSWSCGSGSKPEITNWERAGPEARIGTVFDVVPPITNLLGGSGVGRLALPFLLPRRNFSLPQPLDRYREKSTGGARIGRRTLDRRRHRHIRCATPRLQMETKFLGHGPEITPGQIGRPTPR